MQYYETDEVNLQVFSQFKDLKKTVYCFGFIILHSKLDIFIVYEDFKILVYTFFLDTIFKPLSFLI